MSASISDHTLSWAPRQPVRKARQEPLRILHASKRLFHPADLVVLLQLPKRQEKLQEFVKGQPSPDSINSSVLWGKWIFSNASA